MADYDSSLPIRSEADGTDERVHVKIVDGATPSQRATVDADGLLHIEVHGNNPAGSDEVLRLSELGAVNPDGDYDGTNNTKPASIGLVAHDRGATIDETSQNKRVTAVAGADNTVCLDIALRDEAGAAFSNSNPLPVFSVSSAGDSVVNYDTQAELAVDGTDNHDYTVTALKTLVVSRVWASASGKLKIEVRRETAAASGVFNTVAVGFNSTSNPNIQIEFENKLEVVAGAILRIIRTNLDNQTQDVYSTIIGTEE